MKLPFGLGEITKSVIYGKQNDPYQTRYRWKHRVGTQTRLHVFHRGDEDPDPHDHEWDFWTFPLTDYFEEVWERGPKGVWTIHIRKVEAFHWHFRKATHIHRVLMLEGDSPVRTIVRTGKPFREWGFWRADFPRAAIPSANVGGLFLSLANRRFVPWREYLDIAP